MGAAPQGSARVQLPGSRRSVERPLEAPEAPGGVGVLPGSAARAGSTSLYGPAETL